MTGFLTSDVAVHVMSMVVGVGVGLVVEAGSRRVWVGSMLVVAVFIGQTAIYQPSAVWAAPLLVVALGVTALIVAAVHYSQSPLLAGEPAWRKVIFMLAHGRKVRAAADAKRIEELREI